MGTIDIKRKYKVGYTSGVFDLFHIGHLNVLKRAKEQCDYLIVAVSTDELTTSLKGKPPTIPYEQRAEIVSSIRWVDEVVPEHDVDKYVAWTNLHYDVLFKGSDAAQKDSYKEYERLLKEEGVDVVYFPYTRGISSTKIKNDWRKKK